MRPSEVGEVEVWQGAYYQGRVAAATARGAQVWPAERSQRTGSQNKTTSVHRHACLGTEVVSQPPQSVNWALTKPGFSSEAGGSRHRFY